MPDYRNPNVAYPLTQTDWSLEQLILREIECPVCVNYIKKPIMMCKNNHVVCKNCWEICPSCPTCRTPKSLTRAHILQELLSFIYVPCKWDECTLQAPGTTISHHEGSCVYMPMKCPVGDTHSCLWRGLLGEVKDHLVACHNKNVFFGPSVHLMASFFRISQSRDYTMIFMFNGCIFKFYWLYDLKNGPRVRFGMVSLVLTDPSVQYNYTLMFAKKIPVNRTNQQLMILKFKVSDGSTSDYSFTSENNNGHRLLPDSYYYHDLRRYCNGDDLIYQVKIEPVESRNYG